MSDKSFCEQLFDAFIHGGYYATIFFTTYYLIEKTIEHNGEIKELISRLEKCEKKS